MNGNQITVAGRLTKDPDLRVTESGQTVCKLSLASGRRWKDKAGEWQEATSFFDADVWGDMGENCDESLSKGDAVVIVGQMEQRSYEKDGTKRTVWDLRVDNVAADLRWATVAISRTERKSENGASVPGRL